MFQRSARPAKAAGRGLHTSASVSAINWKSSSVAQRAMNRVQRFVDAHRMHGHLRADLDPLGLTAAADVPHLTLKHYELDQIPSDTVFPTEGLLHMPDGRSEATLAEIVEVVQRAYTGKAAVQFMHCSPEQAEWWAQRVETGAVNGQLENEEARRVWQILQESEQFDKFMQVKFRNVKRYALEGAESMLVAVDSLFKEAAERAGVREAVVVMPHRGRLNLLANHMPGYPARNVFHKTSGGREFPESVRGDGDVLSHLAASSTWQWPGSGAELYVSLIHNPSHLEVGNPVAMGKVRAKQDGRRGDGDGEKDPAASLCLQIHGDAAFTGQGVNAEASHMAALQNYTVQGSVHLIVNNQLGYTTAAANGRATRHAADQARGWGVPTIAVNADSPEHVYAASQLAMQYRREFNSDVFLELVGYRRHGHNELDEPRFTQPIMYQAITAQPSVAALYGKQLIDRGVISSDDVQQLVARSDAHYNEELAAVADHKPQGAHLQGKWKGMRQVAPNDLVEDVQTGVDTEVLREIGRASVTVATEDKFEVHGRIARHHIKSRLAKVDAGEGLDWSTAEAMAFGSLMLDKYGVRISGQDVARGTFSQRHAELYDQTGQHGYIPLNHMRGPGEQGKLQLACSNLSELAVMGFEYGYSMEDPSNLVLWEAQFGDFNNSAQMVIDLFLATGESKWLRQSGLTLLLPNGWEGGGPEHSSARVERFLQLTDSDIDGADEDINFQVANCTTPANYFHLLRRQMLRPFRKPLVVATPKNLLRHPACVSSLEDMAPSTTFSPVYTDEGVSADAVETVLMCSGRVYYDLLEHRKEHAIDNVALVRVEQLAPFPYYHLRTVLDQYPNVQRYTWVQEEPENQGAYIYVKDRITRVTQQPLDYVGRNASAVVASGFSSVFKQQQEALPKRAFGL